MECVQNIYQGKIDYTETKNALISFTLDKTIDISGFSGAPVLDKNGHVAGMLTGAFGDQETENGDYNGAMGYDISIIYQKITKQLK